MAFLPGASPKSSEEPVDVTLPAKWALGHSNGAHFWSSPQLPQGSISPIIYQQSPFCEMAHFWRPSVPSIIRKLLLATSQHRHARWNLIQPSPAFYDQKTASPSLSMLQMGGHSSIGSHSSSGQSLDLQGDPHINTPGHQRHISSSISYVFLWGITVGVA